MLNIEVLAGTIKNEQKIHHAKINWRKGIIKGTMQAGDSVVRRAQTLLNTGIRTGRKYPQLPNRSSAPGEMPRSQSGRLARLMHTKTGSTDKFSVLNMADYARRLSEGDFERNLAPRKSRKQGWLKFVIDQGAGNTEKYLQQGVYKEII